MRRAWTLACGDVVDVEVFAWTDEPWYGVAPADYGPYELQIGTFSRAHPPRRPGAVSVEANSPAGRMALPRTKSTPPRWWAVFNPSQQTGDVPVPGASETWRPELGSGALRFGGDDRRPATVLPCKRGGGRRGLPGYAVALYQGKDA